MGTSVESNREQYKKFLKEQEKNFKKSTPKNEKVIRKTIESETTENKIIRKMIFLNEKQKKEILNYIENIIK